MNDFELLRVIEYLERTRRPYRALFPMADEDPVWNILVHLVKSHLRGDLVTISTLAEAANVPYATALRRIKRMISEQRIIRKARGPKTFSLHPSEATLADFLSYAQHIKSLLAQVMGVRPAEEEADDYYFGGSRLEAQLSPPPNLLRRQSEAERLRFLLHADNYFASLQNLWADFRANRGSRRDFDLRALPDLYRRAADALAAWQQSGVLRTDATPRYYSYRMEFRGPHGEPRHTRGVIGVSVGHKDVLEPRPFVAQMSLYCGQVARIADAGVDERTLAV